MFATAILKTEYLPPISTFWAAINSKNVLLEVNENYQKKSTRNRSKILGANNMEILSVPLRKGKNSKMPISEVRISYENNWQGKHLHSIRSAYGNSPYFEYYFESLRDIISIRHDSLLILNQKLLLFFTVTLHLDFEIRPTEEYLHSYEEDSCDLRNIKFNSPQLDTYTPKKYNQVFEEKHGFVSGISILDLLMCKGPESILYI